MQPIDRPFVKVIDDVRVYLQDADVVADFFRQAQQHGGLVDIGGDAQIGPLDSNETIEVRSQRILGREVGTRREVQRLRHEGEER